MNSRDQLAYDEAQERIREAAPEMLAALKAVQEWLMFPTDLLDPKGSWNESFVKANNMTVAAIAKAEGKS